MDMLSFLKEKKNELDTVIHPFAYKDSSFKYLYCFGLGVLAYGHMKAITETKNCFEGILDTINLHQTYRDRIIIDINNNFDFKINEVLEVIDTKEKQYTFCADLFKLCAVSLWSQSFTDGVLKIYMKIFKFSKEERDFIENFTKASKKKNIIVARSLYNGFIENGYVISYKLLKYMCPSFQLEEEYDSIILNSGQHKYLDKPSIIRGNIEVTNGSSLIISGAEIKIEGTIKVDGGRIEVRNSNIQVLQSVSYLFQIKSSAVVKIEESHIECNFKGGFIHQEEGYLIINNTRILHTKINPSVLFSGVALYMNGTQLEDCLNGGIIVKEEAKLRVDDCSFYNCVADQGGAVYFDSLYDGKISNSIFKNCRAKYIGGAIYFTYKKYEQEIYGCEFIKCNPEDSTIFNYYVEENNTFQ